ncbi:MAG: hypothetical protein R3Y11_04770 [Pseudomonadota bacterium]
MCAVISPMLGNNCCFWLEGRCAYEEMLNPGLHDSWRCTEEQRMMQLYDRFMEQIDGFSIDAPTAVQLWEQRLAKEPSVGSLCTSFEEREYPCGGCRGCGGHDDQGRREDDSHGQESAIAIAEAAELQALMDGGLPSEAEYAELMADVKRTRLRYAKDKSVQNELAYFVARERLKESDALVNRAFELTQSVKAREAANLASGHAEGGQTTGTAHGAKHFRAPADEVLRQSHGSSGPSGEQEVLVDCVHGYGGLCAKLLPMCEGMCERFAAAIRTKN